MAKKVYAKISDINRRKYTTPGMPSYVFRSKNAIYISPSNTIRHEMAKCLGGYMLRKWGDVYFNKKIKDLLHELQSEVEHSLKDWEMTKKDFITEAVPKNDKDRRIDLVRLDDETWFEFETNGKIKKKDSVTVVI